MVTREETDSWWSTLTWRGLIHRVMLPLPMGPLSIVLICKRCCRGCVGILSFVTVLWSMKLPAALGSIRAKTTQTVSECFMRTFCVKARWDGNCNTLAIGVPWAGVGLSAWRRRRAWNKLDTEPQSEWGYYSRNTVSPSFTSHAQWGLNWCIPTASAWSVQTQALSLLAWCLRMSWSMWTARLMIMSRDTVIKTSQICEHF